MKRIIDLHLTFMKRVLQDGTVLQELKRERISILPGFMERVDLVRAYYEKFYANRGNRLVLCGINPGRYGAGETGIPFVDFDGVSRLMSENYGHDQERSAQFILSVIEGYGLGEFQNSVYLTNLSWFGFRRDGRNMNYYNLPRIVRHQFLESFVEEMKIVQPSAIVPLSEEVARELRKLAAAGQLDFPIADRIPHPLHCSFPTNVKNSRLRYHMCIEEHTGLKREGIGSSSESTES